jgi:hypothetical protein
MINEGVDSKSVASNEVQLNRVYLEQPTQQYILIPYNLAKLTFFIFVKGKIGF